MSYQRKGNNSSSEVSNIGGQVNSSKYLSKKDLLISPKSWNAVEPDENSKNEHLDISHIQLKDGSKPLIIEIKELRKASDSSELQLSEMPKKHSESSIYSLCVVSILETLRNLFRHEEARCYMSSVILPCIWLSLPLFASPQVFLTFKISSSLHY
jgi:hypothetical protein